MAGEAVGVEMASPVALRDWLIIAPLVLPVLGSATLVALRRWTGLQAGVTVAVLALMAGADGLLLTRAWSEGPAVMTMGRWPAPFGISFAVDALGAGFALVATLVALVCALSARSDMHRNGVRYGFYPFLLLMLAGVTGAFLTGDLFNLYVWFEVFVIASFGLMVLGSTRAQLDGALKYGMLNLVGTTLFLIATGALYGSFGTLNMADIARQAPELRDVAPLLTLATLFLTAFGMKAAAFPLNFWLPASYHAPPPVASALLAGLLTKVGIYALLRVLVLLFPDERATLAGPIGWVAGLTMVLGALGALAQSDITRLFGFVLISGVGVMLAGLSIGATDALSATILYAAVSMAGMAGLYLLAGAMARSGSSLDLRHAGGLAAGSPVLLGVALILFLSAAGLPPTAGLWPKAMLVRAAVLSGNSWLTAAILVSGFILSLALFRVVLLAFWRDPGEAGRVSAPAPLLGRGSFAGAVVLAAALALGGLLPEGGARFAKVAAAGLLDRDAYIGAVFPTGNDAP